MSSKYLRKLLSSLTAMAMLLTMLPIGPIFATASTNTEFAGGSGTETDPYLIASKEHLNNVRNYLDSHYKMIADIIFSEADFSLGGDFYNDGSGWRPIGEYGIGTFSGTFDGNNHIIAGLNINVTSTSTNAVGLFGLCNGAKIHHLTLSEGEITAGTEKSTIYAGGIVGFLQESTIENCTNFCNVIAGNYMSKAGGIVGYATSESQIRNCKNHGAVTAADVSGSSYAGGIAGEVCSDSVVDACKNFGIISSDYAAGGIAGDIFTRGQISSSYNTGEINAIKHSGGIVGLSYSSVSGCSNSGKVKTASGGACGGIVGHMNGGKVTTSYNTAEINATKTASKAGGVAGASWHGSKILHCFNSGKINGKNGSTGGIVGYIVYESSADYVYNTGEILSTGTKGAIAGYSMTGSNAAIITNALYLENATAGIGSGTDSAAEYTNDQMQQKSTYDGWDFESIWEFKYGNLYPYPTLISNPYFTPKPVISVEVDSVQLEYTSLTDAVTKAPAGSVLQLICDIKEDVTVFQNLCLDLNGFNITGNITTTPGTTFSVKDSQTDDYTIEDSNGYGKIIGTISGVQAENGYMMITESDGISFHRIDLQLTGMTLRASTTGVYYKCNFAGDEMVAQHVDRYGVALSIAGEPTADALGVCSWYDNFVPGNGGNSANGTLLHGIMKTTNTDATNSRNAEMAIYGRAYILTKDGQYIFGEYVSRSFREQVELVDDQWNELTTEQQLAVLDMYRSYKAIMSQWDIPNILKAAQ